MGSGRPEGATGVATGACTSLPRVPAVAAETLRRSPLHDRHVAAGAKLVPFAGWEMPVQYAGIREEHLAVRRSVGVFDVSHMGQIETRGPDALALLQRLLSNDVRRLPEGGAQYSLMCSEDGGVLDDLFTYRLAECHFLTVTNAANHERDLAWFQRHADEFDVDVDRPPRRLRDAGRPGTVGAGAGPRPGRRAAAAPACTSASAPSPVCRCWCAEPATPARTALELLLDPGAAPTVWDAPGRRRGDAGRPWCARHAPARGLLSPLRQRSQRAARADRGRPGLVLPGGDGLHRRRGGGPRPGRGAP